MGSQGSESEDVPRAAGCIAAAAPALEQLDFNSEGFAGKYDFINVPTAKTQKGNLGYAFVNFVDSATASCFSTRFTGYSFPGTQSTKLCEVKPARCQGLVANQQSRNKRQQSEGYRDV